MYPFVSTWVRRLDGKDRLVVPVTVAQVVQTESEGRLYLVPSPVSPMVEAYPARKFLEMAARQIPDRFAGDQTDRRHFFHTAAMVELKGPGRITLPKRFLPYFPTREVCVAGMNDYLELWDPQTWEKHVAKTRGAFPLPEPPDERPEGRE